MAAYVVVEVTITDDEAYEKYKPLAYASIVAHGGRYLVRGGAVDSVEGDAVEARIVVLEFPDIARTTTRPPCRYGRGRPVVDSSWSKASVAMSSVDQTPTPGRPHAI
jgi:uncharacterized protein (DUF1330 family)